MTNQIKNQKSKIKNKLGEPLPASKHAVSVSLPKWADVVGYETSEPRVINAMKTGYPRFVYNPIVKKLFAAAEKKFAHENEFCLAFPSARIAELGKKFCKTGRVEKFSEGIYALILPKGTEKEAKSFWQHPGYIISSRQAEAALTQSSIINHRSSIEAKSKIRAHLASLTGERTDNITLYPSGMAAIFTAFEIITQSSSLRGGNADAAIHTGGASEPGLLRSARNDVKYPTIQLGFPYVDTLKIQEKFGHETIFISDVNDFATLEKTIKEKKPSAVFTEFPTNPLITCVDLEALSNLCRSHGVALVIDDTLSTWANASTIAYADIVVSSLTKFFSGIGDVLAGSLILNSNSPLYNQLKTKLDYIYEDLLYGEDAIVLEKNSRNFEERIAKINNNAEQLYEFLKSAIGNRQSAIHYPKANQTYEKYKTLGYGGIISLVLPTETQAIKFYDALEVNKGPSLGTNYTLACPYTLLAHYHERDFAESAGVPFHLIRVSVGLEDFSELKNKFEAALRIL